MGGAPPHTRYGREENEWTSHHTSSPPRGGDTSAGGGGGGGGLVGRGREKRTFHLVQCIPVDQSLSKGIALSPTETVSEGVGGGGEEEDVDEYTVKGIPNYSTSLPASMTAEERDRGDGPGGYGGGGGGKESSEPMSRDGREGEGGGGGGIMAGPFFYVSYHDGYRNGRDQSMVERFFRRRRVAREREKQEVEMAAELQESCAGTKTFLHDNLDGITEAAAILGMKVVTLPLLGASSDSWNPAMSPEAQSPRVGHRSSSVFPEDSSVASRVSSGWRGSPLLSSPLLENMFPLPVPEDGFPFSPVEVRRRSTQKGEIDILFPLDQEEVVGRERTAEPRHPPQFSSLPKKKREKPKDKEEAGVEEMIDAPAWRSRTLPTSLPTFPVRSSTTKETSDEEAKDGVEDENGKATTEEAARVPQKREKEGEGRTGGLLRSSGAVLMPSSSTSSSPTEWVESMEFPLLAPPPSLVDSVSSSTFSFSPRPDEGTVEHESARQRQGDRFPAATPSGPSSNTCHPPLDPITETEGRVS